MDFLTVVRTLHREAKLPGSAPSAVTGQSGRAADLVEWAAEAYNDIQRDKGGRWNWLHREFTLDTVSGTQSYAYTSATDVQAAAAIDRFRGWDFDEENPLFCYLVSDGVAAEYELIHEAWRHFRRQYVIGSHTASKPTVVAADESNLDKLYLGPKPDGIYTVSGYYWRAAQTLAADSDTPEMPADFHMLIVYRAMVKYGYNAVAQELLARAQSEGMALYENLVDSQWYGQRRLEYSEPLA